jgi:uncharacterized damage-inducible protein DinB
MRITRVWITLVALTLLSTFSIAGFAQATAAAEKAAPAASAFRTDFNKQLNNLEKQIVGLAEAIPQEKYTWRPAEGVRSISEAYLHIAAGNYGIARAAGVKPPADLDMRNFDKSTTDKAKVVDALKKSFEHVRQGTANLTDADLEKETKLFGSPSSVRNVELTILIHASEHLGQSIAYARSVGVTPPWSEATPAAKPADKPKS